MPTFWVAGVEVPPHLRNQSMLLLNYSYRYRIVDFRYDAEEVVAMDDTVEVAFDKPDLKPVLPPSVQSTVPSIRLAKSRMAAT